jgi:hypothetical protein
MDIHPNVSHMTCNECLVFHALILKNLLMLQVLICLQCICQCFYYTIMETHGMIWNEFNENRVLNDTH